MFRTETKKRTIADSWIADGFHVHASVNGWIKGPRRYSETEQNEAKRAIAALCAQICELA